MVKYDKIGIGYSNKRKSDPHIEKEIHARLKDATRILNIGAGTGSYEPSNVELVALEPSLEMISQRGEHAHPSVQGVAEDLPFEDKSFSHSMSTLSMHHWTDLAKAFGEIKRVTKESFIAMTWDPSSPPFWFTKDYFPEVYEKDLKIFPSIQLFQDHFEDVKVTPLLIPYNCEDGFLAAYWRRPEAFMDSDVRQSISAFSTLKNAKQGLDMLSNDLRNGVWQNKYESLSHLKFYDAGYVIITAIIGSVGLKK